MYKKIIFIICMFGAMGMAFANNILYCDKIEVLAQNTGGDDKSTVINASISGHSLTVVFSQNLGDVDVEVLSTSGNFMHNAVDELEVKSWKLKVKS